MKKFKNTRLSAIAVAVFALSGAAMADVGSMGIYADTDNTGNEVLVLQSGNDTYIDINSSDYIGLHANSSINLHTSQTNIYSPTSINSGGGASELTVGTGAVTTSGVLTQTGTTSLSGTTSITGATSINASGTATTNIGTAGGATNIGNVNSVNTIVGTTTSTGAFTQTGVTRINTTAGSGNTTIGYGDNTTMIQSGTNIITGAANSMLSTGANTITAATNNNISAATNNITATTANNIQGPVNNMGTNSVSTNSIGNTSGGTTVTATAGNARQALANGSANTSVTAGASGLASASSTTTGQVLLSNTGGTTVDANGKILTSGATDYVNPAAPTAAVTLTNGLGNTHGLVVTESKTTISGGTESSSMTLTDRAATFSNAQTGAPITVTGVADGRADFDAVNVRQFAGAIASVAAQANIPTLAAGQDRTFGMGVGSFMGKSALAMGMNIRGDGNAVYKVTLSSGLNDGAKKAVFAAGAAWGF